MYKLEVTPAADRDFGRLKSRIRRQDLERLRSAISGLAQNADFGEIGRRFRSKPATISEQIGHPLRGGWSSAEFKPV